MKVALVQLKSTQDPFENLLVVDSFVSSAQEQGADFVCFPENVFYRGPSNNPHKSESIFTLSANREIKNDSDFATLFEELREAWKIPVSLGSVLEKGPLEKPYNAHWIVRPNERRITAYYKIHLFSLKSGTLSYNEHLDFSPGKDALRVDIADWKFGLSICYDLRFPELFRHLVVKEKSEALLVPAAFTRTTGEQHWHTLLRARAIENQVYALAPGQWGSHLDAHGKELFCFGHSIAYDPWGDLVAEAPAEGDALLIVDLSKDRLSDVRGRIPALTNTCFPFHL